MKVMLINSVYGVGSTGKIVKDLYDQINSAGDQAVVCYGRGKDVEDANVIKICSDLSFYSHAAFSRVTGLNGMLSNRATRKLISEIEYFKPDIIHIHNLHGYYLNYFKFVEYLKRTNIPVVWTLHDELMFTGNCAYSFECEKWKTGCFECPQVKEYPKSIAFDTSSLLYNKKRKILSHFSNCTYVTPSAWLGDRVKKSFLNPSNVHVIHNGIDVENIFYPRINKELYESINPEHKKIVLTVTDDVFSKRKGINYIIELASIMSDCLFLIVGGIIKDCKLQNVKFVSLIRTQKDLAEYYSIADAFVITSSCDNFPTVCIEALSCGTPVIGFDTGGTSETAPIETIGWFSPYGELDSLARSIRYFISMNRDDVRKKCRVFAISQYTREAMTLAYINLYHEIMGRTEIDR